jgi:3'(2'), 5'-bisphosphate nucleotidase
MASLALIWIDMDITIPDKSQLDILLPKVLTLAKDAGQAIAEIYLQKTQVAVEIKQDSTPLTVADLTAHKIISKGLNQLANYPVLSEEAADIPYSERQKWQCYWLVDPLDGTREFIERTDEFTVNIALIVGNEPVLGVVDVPMRGVSYAAISGATAFKYLESGASEIIKVRKLSPEAMTVVASRRHGNKSLQSLLDKLGNYHLISMGSALKSCVVAEGKADFYPRLGPTSEWDTAASHCIITQAGGRIIDLAGNDLSYNAKDSLLNPYFLVVGDVTHQWLNYL